MINRDDEEVTLPKTNIGMAEFKNYVQRVYFVNGKPPKKTQADPNPAPYGEDDEGAELYFKCNIKNCTKRNLLIDSK
jgi:hypothetical protein